MLQVLQQIVLFTLLFSTTTSHGQAIKNDVIFLNSTKNIETVTNRTFLVRTVRGILSSSSSTTTPSATTEASKSGGRSVSISSDPNEEPTTKKKSSYSKSFLKSISNTGSAITSTTVAIGTGINKMAKGSAALAENIDKTLDTSVSAINRAGSVMKSGRKLYQSFFGGGGGRDDDDDDDEDTKSHHFKGQNTDYDQDYAGGAIDLTREKRGSASQASAGSVKETAQYVRDMGDTAREASAAINSAAGQIGDFVTETAANSREIATNLKAAIGNTYNTLNKTDQLIKSGRKLFDLFAGDDKKHRPGKPLGDDDEDENQDANDLSSFKNWLQLPAVFNQATVPTSHYVPVLILIKFAIFRY